MLRIGLTGGIGSGKSLVGEYLAELGAIVLDSDQLSREVIERGTAGFDEVVSQFGDGILTNGDIDRKKLGEIVFSNPEARLTLESIIHPRVQSTWNHAVRTAPEDAIVVNQIPLLVETDGKSRFDVIVVVVSHMELRRKRLIERGMNSFEIEKRLDAQVSDQERIDISDYIIENNGSKADLLKSVEKLYEDLAARVK